MEKKILTDKSKLFSATKSELHYVKIAKAINNNIITIDDDYKL